MKYIFGLISAIYLTFIFISSTENKTVIVEKFISEDKKIITFKNVKEDKKTFNFYLKDLNFQKTISEFNCNQNENTINCVIDNEKYQFNNINDINIEDILFINKKSFKEMNELKSSDLDIKGIMFFIAVICIYFAILIVIKKLNKKELKKEIKKEEQNDLKDSILTDLLTKQSLYIFLLITFFSVIAMCIVNYNYRSTFESYGLKNLLNEEEKLGLKQMELENGKLIIKGLSGISENSSNFLNSKNKMINGGSNRINIYTNNNLTESIVCSFDTFFNCDIQGKKITFNVSENDIYVNNINYKIIKIYLENKIEEKEDNFKKIMKAIGIVYLALVGFLVLSKTFFRIF